MKPRTVTVMIWKDVKHIVSVNCRKGFGKVRGGGDETTHTRLKFLSLQIKGGISGNEYLVSHQIKITIRKKPMIMRHKVTGDAHPSVGPSL